MRDRRIHPGLGVQDDEILSELLIGDVQQSQPIKASYQFAAIGDWIPRL